MTVSDADGPMDYAPIRLMRSSVFCMVAKGDSYSSSSFYHAVAVGCIPIVISDWFVFSFPWAVEYEQFVIRLSERDFTTDPNASLDYIRDTIGQDKIKLRQMRDSMHRFRRMLSYEPVVYGSEEYLALMSPLKHFPPPSKLLPANIANTALGTYSKEGNKIQTNKIQTTVIQTIIPMELLLMELRYSQEEYKYYNNIPCYRPYMCYHNRNSTVTPEQAAQRNKHNKEKKVRDYDFTVNPLAAGLALPGTVDKQYLAQLTGKRASNIYEFVDFSGYQVPNLAILLSSDPRSHLCRHNTRLIGHYKIVFFMQCVRILWPLSPGKFKPKPDMPRDPALPLPTTPIEPYTTTDKEHNTEIGAGIGISWKDQQFVLGFHNASGFRPVGWHLSNYPLVPFPYTPGRGSVATDKHGHVVYGVLTLDMLKSMV